MSNSAPDDPSACATASAGGKTTVAGWNTDPLCTSSCSTTCDAAALANAATSGLLRRRWTRISLGPSAGPMLSTKRVRVSTGPEPLPASAEAIQSRNRSSMRRITGAGMASWRSPAANSARAWVGSWVMGCFQIAETLRKRAMSAAP